MDELSDIDLIRRRPGMYVGSTSQNGIQRLLFEAIDNAVDQHLSSKVSLISVRIDNRTIQVIDDGQGYPFDTLDEDGASIGSKYLTHYHRTNTADDHTPHVHSTGGGCGLFALNALSQRFEISTFRGGITNEKTRLASFANAVPTLEESSHVEGLKRALRLANWNPAGAAISVILADPNFAGPTKQVLNVPGLEIRISDLISDAIKQFRQIT